jgi:CHAD domain-containing protein
MQTKSTGIEGGLTVEEAFALILQNNLESVQVWAPIALRGEDIEGVHQMRVCLRRIRSALTVFRSAIRKKTTKSLSNEIRWAAKALDRARDLDVYITENLASKGNGQQKRLRKIAEKHRQEAYEQVEELIKGRRYATLCKEFNDWIEARKWCENISADQQGRFQENITPFASRVLEEHRSLILEYGKEIDQLDNETLHKLRIECKKLRYATEFFKPLYGGKMKSFTGHLKNLQDLLGLIHDTAVMTGLQKDLLKNKKNKKLSSFTHKLERQRQKEVQKILKMVSNRWQAFSEAERPWPTIADAAA